MKAKAKVKSQLGRYQTSCSDTLLKSATRPVKETVGGCVGRISNLAGGLRTQRLKK